MAIAKAYLSAKTFGKWANCLRLAWQSVKAAMLKNLLSEGEVIFSFTKKDGSIRKAVGTTSQSAIADYPFKGSLFETPKLIRFFDIELKEWRCCSFGSILKIKFNGLS